MSLRNAFKNFHKYYHDKSPDDAASTGEPSAKRTKHYTGDEPDIGDDEYTAAVEELKAEYKLKQKDKDMDA